jgi:S-adenosylmethionine hydrolase
MAIVTITSDWKNDDYYAASLQGLILGRCPGTVIVPITHRVPPFNVAIAAFQLRYSFPHFPANTIHMIAVNGDTQEKNPFVAVRLMNQYFIGYDNGIFGLLADEEPLEAVVLKNQDGGTFPELVVFAATACDLIEKGSMKALGTRHEKLHRKVAMLPAIDESVITGNIVYIDSYRNAFTNISRELFEQIGKGRPFELLIQSNRYRISRIHQWYGETSRGELLALFNSIGLLEIAINGGNAADLLNLGVNSTIRIRFREVQQQV